MSYQSEYLMSTLNKDRILENFVRAFKELKSIDKNTVVHKNLELRNEGFFGLSKIIDTSTINSNVLTVNNCSIRFTTPKLSNNVRPFVKIMSSLAGVHSYKDGVADNISMCTFDEYRFQYSTYMSTEIMIGLECLYTLYKNELTPKGTIIVLYCDSLECLENIYE